MATISAAQGSLIGATLGGYEVQSLIGRGAMGAVYLARDVELNRQVALKVLLGSLARTPAIVKQFQLEAQAASPLNHPGIVRVYSAGIENGTPYMAMEFVDGEPLDRFLRRVGRLKWQQAFGITGQVALALECAHTNGIVHRDVKPANILLDRNGGVRLTDFGIASIQSDDIADSDGSPILGTPQYMSPEQVKGQKVGPASDLFSLGVTLFQMIAAEMPFRGESSMALIKSICTDEPPRLNKVQQGIPDDVARLVAYLMEKRPEMRPANARTVHALVSRLLEQRGGNSAVPAALTAFIRDQAQPRPFTTVGPGTARSSKRPSTVHKRGFRRFPKQQIVRAAALVAVGAIAMAISPVMSVLAREGPSEKASAINLAAFRDLGGGVVTSQLFAEGYRFKSLRWIGDHPALLLEAEGLPGGLTAGAVGWLAVDPDNRQLISVRAPSGPCLDQTFWQHYVPSLGATRILPSPPGTPLHEAALMRFRETPGGPAILLAQRWDDASPRPHVLYRAPNDLAEGGAGASRDTVIAAITKPDGVTLCLVFQDSLTKTHYLVERNVRHKPLDAVGQRLIPPGIRIVPESVQYSPAGQRLAYLRETDDATRELWVLEPPAQPTQRLIPEGLLLARGVVGDAFAFSPNGERLAYMSAPAPDDEPRIVVADTEDGRVISDLGPGRIGPEAWSGQGQQIMLIAPGESLNGQGRDQMWTVEALPPFARKQLTAISDGVTSDYATSRDGRWVAAVAANETFPTLVFIDLTQAPVGNPT